MERMMKYFFLASHVQYADYMTQYVLEMCALPEEANVDIVCQHLEWYWNAVSADQFGEQTAIKICKGVLKGMSLSADLVSEWINAFSITLHMSDRVDYIYSTYTSEQSAQQLHKVELKHRHILDAYDQGLIEAEVEKYPNPLEDHRPHLYNPVIGHSFECCRFDCNWRQNGEEICNQSP